MKSRQGSAGDSASRSESVSFLRPHAADSVGQCGQLILSQIFTLIKCGKIVKVDRNTVKIVQLISFTHKNLKSLHHPQSTPNNCSALMSNWERGSWKPQALRQRMSKDWRILGCTGSRWQVRNHELIGYLILFPREEDPSSTCTGLLPCICHHWHPILYKIHLGLMSSIHYM